MLTTEIMEKIEHLEDDVLFYKKIINNPIATKEEKSDCRSRMRTSNNELMRLKSLLISLRGDKLMYGDDYDKQEFV